MEIQYMKDERKIDTKKLLVRSGIAIGLVLVLGVGAIGTAANSAYACNGMDHLGDPNHSYITGPPSPSPSSIDNSFLSLFGIY